MALESPVTVADGCRCDKTRSAPCECSSPRRVGLTPPTYRRGPVGTGWCAAAGAWQLRQGVSGRGSLWVGVQPSLYQIACNGKQVCDELRMPCNVAVICDMR